MPGSAVRRFAQARACAVEVDLIVMAAGREEGELGEVIGEPGGLVRQKDEAVFDHSRLRVKPHDLVAVRRITRDMGKTRELR